MKKLLLVAAACVALASCVKNEMDFEPADKKLISYQALVKPEATRAEAYNNADVRTDNSVAWASKHLAEVAWKKVVKEYNDDREYAPKYKLVVGDGRCVGEIYAQQAGVWEQRARQYWYNDT